MLRTVGGVIAGYVAMVVFIFVMFSISFLVMGVDRAFVPGSYQVTMLWIVVSIVLSFVAAIIGGKICALVARSPGAVMGLASLVLILGVVSAIPVLRAANKESVPRTGDASITEAMTNVKEPVWITLLLPWVGLGGVMIGGKVK